MSKRSTSVWKDAAPATPGGSRIQPRPVSPWLARGSIAEGTRVSRRARGEAALPLVRLLLAQHVQPTQLPDAEAAGDAPDDLVVRRRDHLGGQPFQDRDAGNDDPAPSHLLGKGRHDRRAVGRDQGDAEQPMLQLPAMRVR